MLKVYYLNKELLFSISSVVSLTDLYIWALRGVLTTKQSRPKNIEIATLPLVARNDNSKQNQMSRDLCDTTLVWCL